MRYYRYFLKYILILGILEYSLLYSFRNFIIPIFTKSEDLLILCKDLVGLLLLISSIDFIQGSLYGVVKALNLQNKALFINLITYYVIAIPLGYFISFKYGTHQIADQIEGIETFKQVNG